MKLDPKKLKELKRKLRFYIEDERSCAWIGRKFGVSRQRVNVLYHQVVDKSKKHSKEAI